MTDSATFTTPEASDEDLGDLLLEVLPGDGSTMGNLSAREALSRAAERQISEEEYEAVKDKALGLGLVVKGRGRGGSIALADGIIKNKIKTNRKDVVNTENEGKRVSPTKCDDEVIEYLIDTCSRLAGLQKTLRWFPEFLEEEQQTLELCFKLSAKLREHASEEQLHRLNCMFYG